ncbi:glycosyltransferase [Rhodococcus sp. 3Y1]
MTPIDVDDLTAARTKFGWSPDETIVLHTGNMGVKQGLENVVEAARLADEQSLPIRSVLVGDGNQRPNLEAAAVGVDRIDFVRPLDDQDFRTAMAAADVLLVNEAPGIVGMAVPSKLTSYFSSGTPIVAATDVASTTADEIRASGAGVVTRTVIPQACSLQPYNSRATRRLPPDLVPPGSITAPPRLANRVHRQMRKVDPRAGGRPQLVRELLGTNLTHLDSDLKTTNIDKAADAR